GRLRRGGRAGAPGAGPRADVARTRLGTGRGARRRPRPDQPYPVGAVGRRTRTAALPGAAVAGAAPRARAGGAARSAAAGPGPRLGRTAGGGHRPRRRPPPAGAVRPRRSAPRRRDVVGRPLAGGRAVVARRLGPAGGALPTRRRGRTRLPRHRLHARGAVAGRGRLRLTYPPLTSVAATVAARSHTAS